MTHSNQAYEAPFNGERGVWLKAGSLEACVLPDVGANLIAYRDTEKGYAFLREPGAEEMDAFKARPFVHGIPVLFPPNRYEDGRFPWQGKVYSFPVNEPSTGNHLHGFVHSLTWAVDHYSADELESRVQLSLQVGEGHPVYAYIPHAFTIRLRYTLSAEGLVQHVLVRNDGRDRMPCLLAFHTTVKAPFAPGSRREDCSLKLTIGQRWELDERMLPTGRHQPLSPDEERMKADGVWPYFEAMDNHYTAVPQDGRNRMELTDARAGVKLVYDVGTAYKQWMIWNNEASADYFCPEPQMNLVNAPHSSLPADEIGLIGLEPGEIWEETSRLYAIPL